MTPEPQVLIPLSEYNKLIAKKNFQEYLQPIYGEPLEKYKERLEDNDYYISVAEYKIKVSLNVTITKETQTIYK
jgi:hypothetical protein